MTDERRYLTDDVRKPRMVTGLELAELVTSATVHRLNTAPRLYRAGRQFVFDYPDLGGFEIPDDEELVLVPKVHVRGNIVETRCDLYDTSERLVAWSFVDVSIEEFAELRVFNESDVRPASDTSRVTRTPAPARPEPIAAPFVQPADMATGVEKPPRVEGTRAAPRKRPLTRLALGAGAVASGTVIGAAVWVLIGMAASIFGLSSDGAMYGLMLPVFIAASIGVMWKVWVRGESLRSVLR